MPLHSGATSNRIPGSWKKRPFRKKDIPETVKNRWAAKAEECWRKVSIQFVTIPGNGTVKIRKDKGNATARSVPRPKLKKHAAINNNTKESVLKVR